MLVIHPEQCIDCGVCVPECPVDAIKADTEEGMAPWVEFNQKYAQIWPNILEKKDPPHDADAWSKITHKMPYFSEKPGGRN